MHCAHALGGVNRVSYGPRLQPSAARQAPPGRQARVPTAHDAAQRGPVTATVVEAPLQTVVDEAYNKQMAAQVCDGSSRSAPRAVSSSIALHFLCAGWSVFSARRACTLMRNITLFFADGLDRTFLLPL
jgi:hypothetical protein